MSLIPETGAAAVTLDRAAEILDIGRSTAYELVRRGEFPIEPLLVGKRKRYPLWRIEQFLAGESAHDAPGQRPAPTLVGERGDQIEAVA